MTTERLNDQNVIESDLGFQTVQAVGQEIISSAKEITYFNVGEELNLSDKNYIVQKLISFRSGEAEIYLLKRNDFDLVLKYYRQGISPKDETIIKLKEISHPGIIQLIDFGYHNNRFFELMEFAQGGTLTDSMPFNLTSELKIIVRQIVEALHCCHLHKVIHRDIKPENIFYRDKDKTQVALADFGIASNVKEGEESVRTTTSRTGLYAAPELFMGVKDSAGGKDKTILDYSVDFYALGISLLHLYTGKSPFQDVDEYSIMKLKLESKIHFPEKIDREIETLIKGLITVNPKDRWGYEQVISWLNGDDVKVKYFSTTYEYPPYSYGIIDGEKVIVNNPEDLAYYLERYPELGEGHLYRNTIAKWIQTIDQGLFNELMDIVEKDYPSDKKAGLTKAIYILNINKPFTGHDHTKLKTLPEIASYFEKHFEYYKQDLRNPNASFYVFLETRDHQNIAERYRGFFKHNDAEAALNQIIIELEINEFGDTALILDNSTYYHPSELLRGDNKALQRIVNGLSNPNSKLSVWVANYPDYLPSINKWRLQGRFDEITISYALQLGFKCKGSFYKNPQEFNDLFNQNFDTFFLSNDKSRILREEAYYWLTTYFGVSMEEMIFSCLKENETSHEVITTVYNFVLTKNIQNEFIYKYIEVFSQLAVLQKDSSFPESVKNYILHYWDYAYQNNNVCYKDCITDFISFIKPISVKQPQFASQLVKLLDDVFYHMFKKDADYIAAIPEGPESYMTSLYEIAKELSAIDKNITFGKNISELKKLITTKTSFIKHDIYSNKQKLAQQSSAKFQNLQKDRLENYKKNWGRKGKQMYRFYLSLSILCMINFLGAILNSWSEMTLKAGNEFDAFFLVLYWSIGIYFGYRLGLLTGKKRYAIILALVIPLPSFWILYIPTTYLIILSVAGIIFGIYKYKQIKAKISAELNNVGLSIKEQENMNQDIQNIESHYSANEITRINQEIMRIIRLNSEEVKKELK